MLTDRAVQSLKPAASGKRYMALDALVPGLAVRVTDKGTRTYVLTTRYPGSSNPTRGARWARLANSGLRRRVKKPANG